MGENKQLRKKVAGLERRIRDHIEKIEEERAKPVPRLGLIACRRGEIERWEKQITGYERRLKREW